MATLTIYPDFECKVFIDTELHGIASANSEYEITLEQGVYWVECRSTEQPSLSYDFDYKATSSQEQTRIEVILRPEIRLQELKAKYDFVGEFQYGFAEVRHEGGLVGYVDENYTFCYDEITLLCDNVLRVCSIGKYGVINFSKEVIVPIKYDEIELLGDATLRLKLNNRYGLSDSKGVKITALKYLNIVDVRNNIFALYFDKWLFMDIQGNEISTPDNVILYTVNDRTCINYEIESVNKKISHHFDETNNTGVIIYDDDVSEIGRAAFMGCSNITSINIPNSVTLIGYMAFYGCVNLGSITIPNGVISIGQEAFYGCKSLESITIPNNIASIGQMAFRECCNLKEFKGRFASDDGRCIIINGELKAFAPAGLTSYTIPDDVSLISHRVFGFSNLEIITIPNCVKEICGSAFSDCCKLKEFKGRFASDDGRCIIIDGELKAFAPAGLTTYNIPNNVTFIGDNAFSGCSYLESIFILNNVTEIGDYAFSWCSRLTNLTIPNSVTKIGDGAFYECHHLKDNIIIPDNVVEIGDNLFEEEYYNPW